MTALITRRTFLWLSSLGGVAVLVPRDLSWIHLLAQTDVQRTLEALANVLLPGRGAPGTEADEPGALDSQLYGQTFYQHLTSAYFSSVIDQRDLSHAARALDLAARCVAPFIQGFWALRPEEQLGVVAFVTRRPDEGEAPNLTRTQKACLRLGGGEGRVPEAVFLRLFAGLLFYSSNPGLERLKHLGYPGPNWGFNPARGWVAMDNPHLRDEDLDLFGGLIPSIAPGTLPPELVKASAR